MALAVATGCGVVLAASPARATPEPPKLAAGTRTFAVFAGRAAPIKLTWAPVPGAARYRVRWTSGGLTTEIETVQPVFERGETTPGKHTLTLTAIDSGGLESAPTDIAIDVIGIEATAPGSKTPAPSPTGAYAIGAKFSSPGLRCQLGTGAPAAEVIARVAGAFGLRCGGDPGQPTVEVPVVIAPVVVASELAPVARDTETRLHVTVASVGAIGDHLEIAAIGDLDLGPAERVAGGLDIPVTASADATSAGLVIRANSVELGRIAIDLVDKPKPQIIPPPEYNWFALDLGAHIGGFLPPDVGASASNLGQPLDPNDSLSGGPLLGIRLGLFPTRRVGVELEESVGTSAYTGRLGTAALLLTKGQLAVRIGDEGRFGLRGLIGGDALTTLTSAGTSRVGTLGGVHYGGAFTIETRPGVSVRLEALHVITVAQDAGYAHCLEVQIGVVTRLGRRDHFRN